MYLVPGLFLNPNVGSGKAFKASLTWPGNFFLSFCFETPPMIGVVGSVMFSSFGQWIANKFKPKKAETGID